MRRSLMIFISKSFWTIVFICIVYFTMFRLLYPPAFLRCSLFIWAEKWFSLGNPKSNFKKWFLFYYLQQKTERILWEEPKTNDPWHHENWESNLFDTKWIETDARSEQIVKLYSRSRTDQELWKGKISASKWYSFDCFYFPKFILCQNIYQRRTSL